MKTILLVEDDETFGFAAQKRLEVGGYSVITVLDTIAALKELESDRVIDLAIIDVRMPDGFPNGLSLARMAALRRKGLPIIFVTGAPELIKKEVADDTLVFGKPVSLDELVKAVAARLAE